MFRNFQYSLVLIIFIFTNQKVVDCQTKPNIVIIVADDLGFHDCSFHGSDEIKTPNIDAIGYNGIILNKHYVESLCSPSRAALMTGKYSIRTGFQNSVILPLEPRGLPLTETILPQYLKTANYKTYKVGKWHLGMFKKAYNPIQRGYDSFYGYLGPVIDYYDHSLLANPEYGLGYDMRMNESVFYGSRGRYATDLFTEVAVNMIEEHNTFQPMFLIVNHLAPHATKNIEPLQVPEEEVNKFLYIKDVNRRRYAAMVSILDKGVGRVVKALDDKGILNNTVILFMADNGAPTIGDWSNSGSNFPFRGQKSSPWEGALRSASVIWSTKLKERERVSNQLIHITDWLPTFLGLAGIKVPKNVDGFDMWKTLSLNERSPRKSILHNIDEIYGYSSYQRNDWKYVNGSTFKGIYDNWLGVDNSNENKDPLIYEREVINSDAGKALIKFSGLGNSCNGLLSAFCNLRIRNLRFRSRVSCGRTTINNSKYNCSYKQPCLFNLISDPCERFNLASVYPRILKDMASDVEKYRKSAVRAGNVPLDPRAAPNLHNFTWTWWQE